MDEPTPLARVERTFWTVWNYITDAVTRLMRSEPAVNNPGTLDQELIVGKTVGFGRAESDPSQRDEEEKKEGEKEQTGLNTASLPLCTQPPISQQPRTDILYNAGLIEKIDKKLAADRPEDEAGQNTSFQEEARVTLSDDEDIGLNELNSASGLEMEGTYIATETITCVNEENLERTEGGGGRAIQKASSTNPENTGDGTTEPSSCTLKDDHIENHLKHSEAAWETKKAEQEITISDFVSPFVKSPELNLSSLVSNDDNAVVGQKQLEVKGEEKGKEEDNSFLIEGRDNYYRKGSYADPVGNQKVVGTKEEITKEGVCRRVSTNVEETTPVKNQDDAQNNELQLQEEVNQTREEEEEAGASEMSVILLTAQDKELNYTMNTEAKFSNPEHLPCFGDTEKHDTKYSQSTSGDEDWEDGEGGVSTQRSVGINSPGWALMVKMESSNEQDMTGELQDVSRGMFPGSGAGALRLNFAPHEETRGTTPEVNNGQVAAPTNNTEQRAQLGRDSEERWVMSRLPHAPGGFKYVAGVGEVYPSQLEDQNMTLQHGEREYTAAGPDVIARGSVDLESLVDCEAQWGIEQMSGKAEQATGEEGDVGWMEGGLSDEECSRHEAHKTSGEHFKTEEPLLKFPLGRERSESTEAVSEMVEAVASENIVRSSIWYDEVALQEDIVSYEEILILPNAVIHKTALGCEGESTAAAMTEEIERRALSQTEHYIEPDSINQPIDKQLISVDDGQKTTKEIVADISDEVMAKEVSNAGSEETTESVGLRNTGESNSSKVETEGPGSLTDMTSEFLRAVKQDLSGELLQFTSSVTEPQTETSTPQIIDHMEVVSAVKAAEDDCALAFGQVTEMDEKILARWVLPDTDTTPDTTETENQAVSHTLTRTPSSDDDVANKMSKTHETPNDQPNFEVQIQDPDEMKEISGQIEAEEDEELPLESYSCQSELLGSLGISDILQVQECEDSEHHSGGEGTPEWEVLTTKPEGIRLSDMLMTVHPGVPDVSPHSFTEERKPSPQHRHPPESTMKLSDNKAISSEAERDELLYKSQINEDTSIKEVAIELDPEVSVVAMSCDGAADYGRDETSVIPVTTCNSIDQEFMKPGVEDSSLLLPDMKLSKSILPPEVDSIIRGGEKEFGENRQGRCLDSKHACKASLRNQAQFRWSGLITSPVPVLSAEEKARQRHSLPPGTSTDEFELDINVLDLSVQKSRILVKNPSTRPPADPRALLQMPSLEPSPSHPSIPQQALPLAGRPFGGINVGMKLPGFGVGFPALKKTEKVVKEGNVPEQESEHEREITMSPKPIVAECKPRWTPPKQPGFGNPLMSELKSKLKKTSKE